MSWFRDGLLDDVSDTELRQARTCPLCRAQGVVDFLDFVRGQAFVHCLPCQITWKEPTTAPMSHLLNR